MKKNNLGVILCLVAGIFTTAGLLINNTQGPMFWLSISILICILGTLATIIINNKKK